LTNTTADYRGARGSNAGDQFHELWALQRALTLLEAGSGLAALTVEGVATESKADDDQSSTWDGVDCALYSGGQTIETADKIELVQLKYSSANPTGTWTTARLTENTKAKGNNSALRKLT
jgi:hypothetical protein